MKTSSTADLHKMAKNKVGKIYPSKTLFLRENVGTAAEGKLKYEMTTIIGSNTPLIHSEQTGKWFSLTWPDILNLARAAGIDRKD